MAATHSRVLWRYAFLNWLIMLVQVCLYFREIQFGGKTLPLFAAAIALTYSLIYLLPFVLLLLALIGLLRLRPVAAFLAPRLRPAWILFPCMVVAMSAVQVLIFADRFIFHLYGFHLNGFVWNLVMTRGGIESLGGGTSTNVSFALIIAGLTGVQVVLLALVVRAGAVGRLVDRALTRRKVIAFCLLMVAAGAYERVTYGYCSLRGNAPVLAAAEAFPFYLPTTFSTFARRLGFKVEDDPAPRIKMASTIRYPLKPIRREPVARPLNIVWLVSESLRADALNPEIMPRTCEFAKNAATFTRHYSGGNGTRMAMFSMFYGLYGTYWFGFLNERRGPVLMDAIIDSNYQVELFTSAKFTYPEFDKTLFARVPAERLHEGEAQPKWRRDRENVQLLLDFIEKCDPARPFMTFLFFESAHANYYFTQDNVVRKPYCEDLNYATMDLARDIGLIKARYDNACNHLDTQYARIFDYLRERKLLDSTIVLITGDHGEEFMEKGHWGHNNGYTEEQTLVPMVLWVPGRAPVRVDRMTSHLDIPATLMPLLGVTNPPEDYSFGHDMFGPAGREFTLICDWDSLCYVDQAHKATFPVSGYSWRDRRVTTRDDRPVANPAEFYQAARNRMVDLIRQMKAFTN